ncbi:MAG: hypothetical protein RLY31_2296 [Bacteroidota bacterium]|jgi:signal transduction histidine kinase
MATAVAAANKILLIEDNPGDARLVEIYLSASDLHHCEVVHAVTLQDGITRLEQGDEYAAILLDLTLPDSRGFETLERLTAAFPNNNIIVLTGVSDKDLGIKAVKAGAQDFLVKSSFDSDQLAKSLRFSIERKKILQRLEETQRLANIGNWEYFPESGTFRASDELYRIFDIPSHQRISKWDPAIVATDLTLLSDLHQAALLEGSARQDARFLTSDKQERFITLRCMVTFSDDQQRVLHGIVQDVTERRHAEEIRKASELARRSALMKEQFLAGISHEMRTPMNAILGMSHLLLQSGLPDEQLRLVESIRSSSSILLGVVNDILEISAIQHGKIVFDQAPFELMPLLQELVNVMQYKAQEKDIFLELTVPPDLHGHLHGDKLRLNQILYNLVGNAIKFTDNGRVSISVHLTESTDELVRLRFSILDTGIGIQQDQLEAIFETFTRIRHKHRIYEGTGLGLSISKQLIDLQGGRIWAKSQPGNGSEFTFELPFGKSAPPEWIPPERPSADELLPPDTQFRLLLVEDHPLNQLVASKILRRKWENIDLSVAENGSAAIDRFQQEDFDLILMDIQMPVMDGYETTMFIRTQMGPTKSGIPIIAMTAHAHIAKDEKFRSYQLDDFVLKPFEPDDLYHKISKYVKRHS